MKKKGKTMNNKYKLIKFDKDDIGHNDNVLGIAKIYDYSVLENAEGNRNFLPKAIKDVRDSVANLGFISCPIAVQKGKKFIIYILAIGRFLSIKRCLKKADGLYLLRE